MYKLQFIDVYTNEIFNEETNPDIVLEILERLENPSDNDIDVSIMDDELNVLISYIFDNYEIINEGENTFVKIFFKKDLAYV